MNVKLKALLIALAFPAFLAFLLFLLSLDIDYAVGSIAGTLLVAYIVSTYLGVRDELLAQQRVREFEKRNPLPKPVSEGRKTQ